MVGWIEAMELLAVPRGRAAEAVAPEFAGGFMPVVPDVDDDETVGAPNSARWRPGRLAGATFAIDYVDAKAARSWRRITAMKLFHDYGTLMLRAWCHERQAYRSFRLDRIRFCFNRDGDVFDLESFLREGLGLDFVNLMELIEPEDMFGVGLRLLSALAAADGFVHPAEVDRIVQYCVAVCDGAGVGLPNGVRAALPRLVSGQRPTVVIIEKSLRTLRRPGALDRRLFATYAREVVVADGVIRPEEVALGLRLREALEA